MPFVNRFASPYAPPERGPFAALRKHPVIVLSGAATGGVLLGAFVAAQLFATPATKSDGASSLHAAAEIKSAPRIAETTGSGAAESRSASADCDRQTWPYLSRDCMKNGGVRVVSPDRPAQARTDAPQPAPVAMTPPAIASATMPAAATPAAVEPAPLPAAVEPPAPAETRAADESKEKAEKLAKAKRERVAKRAAHERAAHERAAHKRKIPAKQQFNDDDGAFASNDDDDVRVERHATRSPRIVQSWTERDYDVPDDRGEGRRRVTVIRRGESRDRGNPFEALFGNFGD